MSLILLQRAIAYIFSLFQAAEASGIKELALVSEAHANILLLKSALLNLAPLGIVGRSTFNKRPMFQATITPAADHFIHKPINTSVQLPTHRFIKIEGLSTSPKQ